MDFPICLYYICKVFHKDTTEILKKYMKVQNLTFEEKRKFVEDFRGLIYLTDIATAKGIGLPLVSMIISGDRTDHYNVIDDCYSLIEKKLQQIMPSHK